MKKEAGLNSVQLPFFVINNQLYTFETCENKIPLSSWHAHIIKFFKYSTCQLLERKVILAFSFLLLWKWLCRGWLCLWSC